MALLITRLAEDAGGRMNPSRIVARPEESDSRKAYAAAQEQSWLDRDGYVTPIGREALEQWGKTKEEDE